MKIKKKLKDITFKEYKKWKLEVCDSHVRCDTCLFNSVNCSTSEKSWVNNKNLFSNEFLNQELEINTLDILDEKEKQYLQNVIKPFRDRVKSIAKQNDINGYEYISIGVFYPINKSNSCFDTDHVFLPLFKRGTMYKNMEVGREYTLEELEL